MKFKQVLLASIMAVGFAGIAQADPVAMLYIVQGKVLVNQGQKFVPAKPGMALNVGDRVLVMDGARANVEYGSGCSLPLASNSAVTITARCQRLGTPALLAAGDSPINYTPALIIGGVALVGVLVANSGGSNNPISP